MNNNESNPKKSAPPTPIDVDVDGIDVDGYINILTCRPRARTHARVREGTDKRGGRALGTACTWLEACECVDQIITTMFGTPKDRGIWVWYATHLGTAWMLDLAFRVHSEWKQGELHNPVRAFQRHLMEALPKNNPSERKA